MSSSRMTVKRFVRIMLIVIGVVMVWRGIWYVLDAIDVYLFNGNHEWTALAGIVLGLLILYLPDRDLREIEKL